MRLTIALITLILVAVQAASADEERIDPDQRYLLLATSKTGTMQKELDQAAAEGFKKVLARYLSVIER